MRWMVLATTAAMAAGCDDRVTAPRARDVADRTQQKLMSGDFSQVQGGISDLFSLGLQYATRPYQPANIPPVAPFGAATIIRDGEQVDLMATVVERVYLPPSGTRARPYVTKALVGWGALDPQHMDRTRLVALLSNDTVAQVIVPSGANMFENSPARQSRRTGIAYTVDPGDRRAWFGTEGHIEITDGIRMGACPYADEFGGGRTGFAELQWSKRPLVCDTRQYRVSVATFVERGDPNVRPLMAEMRTRGTLRMEPQSIPGVRFVTQCVVTHDPMENPQACWNVNAFWRDDAQFAPELGIDLAAMKSLASGTMAQVVDPGSGPDYRYERGGYDMAVEYAAYSADGRQIFKRPAARIQGDTVMRHLPDIFDMPMRVGYHVRLLSRATHFDVSANPYELCVVDVRVLPFK